jgi:hypothetical protein
LGGQRGFYWACSPACLPYGHTLGFACYLAGCFTCGTGLSVAPREGSWYVGRSCSYLLAVEPAWDTVPVLPVWGALGTSAPFGVAPRRSPWCIAAFSERISRGCLHREGCWCGIHRSTLGYISGEVPPPSGGGHPLQPGTPLSRCHQWGVLAGHRPVSTELGVGVCCWG